MTRFIEYTTSAAVTGRPVENFAGRRVNAICEPVAVGVTFQLDASRGRTLLRSLPSKPTSVS